MYNYEALYSSSPLPEPPRRVRKRLPIEKSVTASTHTVEAIDTPSNIVESLVVTHTESLHIHDDERVEMADGAHGTLDTSDSSIDIDGNGIAASTHPNIQQNDVVVQMDSSGDDDVEAENDSIEPSELNDNGDASSIQLPQQSELQAATPRTVQANDGAERLDGGDVEAEDESSDSSYSDGELIID